MASLIFNAVLRIDSPSLRGFFRVVAVVPGGDVSWLAYVAPWSHADDDGAATKPHETGALYCIERASLEALQADDRIRDVELAPSGRPDEAEALGRASRTLWDRRRSAMAPFLNPNKLCDCLASTGGLGPLVREAVSTGTFGRASVYRLWRLLCVHGFLATSLLPRFDRCGGPGMPRPVTESRRKAGAKTRRERLFEPEPSPQRGVTADDRTRMLLHYRRIMKPGETFRGAYEKVIGRLYVKQYIEMSGLRLPVVPEQGTYPNLRQFRHIVESQTRAMERVRLKTTQGHFKRNLRGLIGRSFDGVHGPGHVYAIDSTIGDIYLCSSINRAWCVGRPIVYVAVDVWSTAIVGFYVGLDAPAWREAKLALLSTALDPHLMAGYWGYEYVPVLLPAPTLPGTFLCDRGEYLSEAARNTALALAFSIDIAPSYRPDLKGLVEVLHRITKDHQFSNFVPGAIDARRRELEQRTNARDATFTMREYAAFLVDTFDHYNLYAERSTRLTGEMIAAGVHPSPAGIWRFGHEAGLGFRRAVARGELITHLMRPGTLDIRRDGLFFESLQYDTSDSELIDAVAHARNFAGSSRVAYVFPAEAGRIWTPTAGGMLELTLRPNARVGAGIPVDEWRDAHAYSRLQRGDMQHQRVSAGLALRARREAAIAHATEEKKRAVATWSADGSMGIKEARAIEKARGSTAGLAVPDAETNASNDTGVPPPAYGESDDYTKFMDQVFERLGPRDES